MKHFILPATLVLALAGTAAFAQQPAPAPDTQPPAPVERHHAPNPEKESARMSRQLGLTADQTAKLEPILADRDQKISAIRNNTQLSNDERIAQLKEVRKSTQAEIRGLLTPDQLQQMKASRKAHEQQQPEPASATPPPPAA